MPTYEYSCESCGHHFEVFQSMKDPKLTDCPESGCDGPVRRLLGTGAGLIFKGGGFYQTDYRSESYKQGAKKESEAANPKAAESDASTTSGDSKAAASKPGAAKSEPKKPSGAGSAGGGA
jgi:putative FmdB family regulatory protein